MNDLSKKQTFTANKIFRDVIEKKVLNNVDTSLICKKLNLSYEEVENYFLGISKNNLLLGIKILNFLESKEDKVKVESV